MRRAIGLLGTILLVLLIFGLYTGVHEVKGQEKALKDLDLKIAQEAESIRVLKADWTYFNQPERLQALARQRLKLSPTSPSQIVIMANLPERAADVPAAPAAVTPSQIPFRASEVEPFPLPPSMPSRGPSTQVSP